MRLIDADKLYKYIDDEIYTTDKYAEVEDILDIIAEFAEETPNKWIPCSERLPKENEYVGDVCKYYLIQDEYGDMYVAHLSSVGWIPIDSLKAISDEVVAWKPLPQPYKAEVESEE